MTPLLTPPLTPFWHFLINFDDFKEINSNKQKSPQIRL
nr:MAG TPA: hypothetical protein [Caudoviricetes sp.]